MSLSDILIQKDYHPVILVGVPSSGKTALLVSLIRYLKTRQKLSSVPVDEPLEESEEGRNNHELAETFIGTIVNSYDEGKIPARTPVNQAYLIPLEITKIGGKTAHLAILELAGELLSIDRSIGRLTRQLPEVVLEIYKNYKEPISIIFIGPYIPGDQITDSSEDRIGQFRDCDLSLEGNMKLYRRHRNHPKDDNIMFLLTKWDVYTRYTANPEFIKPPPKLVRKLIGERFRNAWNEFERMSKTKETWSKEFEVMAYSAGSLGYGDIIWVDNPIDDDEFDSVEGLKAHPRRLWDWLYFNATDEHVEEKQKPTFFSARYNFVRKALS
jgi:hypothetical protein